MSAIFTTWLIIFERNMVNLVVWFVICIVLMKINQTQKCLRVKTCIIILRGHIWIANALSATKWHPWGHTVYPKKYAHGFCFAVLCCGYTLTDFPISIRLTSLALRQSNDCPSASKATMMNMDKYYMWIHYERLHNHNKAKHNKTVCIFLGIYCSWVSLCKNLDSTLYASGNFWQWLPVNMFCFHSISI